ncbi:MAG: hypothetical protein H0X51_06440 [Parachlamydiaceae bacterium]|nr:hypothetical protein [Parachlamydiaceae bacterium]
MTLTPFLQLQQHPAWLGRVSGLKAEKMLRGRRKPYLYVLRAGESDFNYYITFILPDFSVTHQPFMISQEAGEWSVCNEQSYPISGIPISDVIHVLMKCKKDEGLPFTAETVT